MARKSTSKKGLPKALQAEVDEEEQKAQEPTLEQFVDEMHGGAQSSTLPEGWPSREWLQEKFQTKSAIIRYLISTGKEIKDIAKHYGFRYQHVRNVSKNELKRGPNEDWRKPYLEGTDIPDPKDFNPEQK